MRDLYPFLYGLDPRATWPGFLSILVAAVAALAVVIIRPKSESVWRPRLIRFGTASILVLLVVQFAIMGAYLAYPSYLDDVEAAIVATSWLGWQGGPLYPSFETGDVFGVVYGPVLLEANGFILWLFRPSVVASKLLGAGAFVSTQILALIVFRRSGATVTEALTFVGTQCLLQSGFNVEAVSAFGANANPLLFLAGEASVLAAISRPSIANAGFLGLVAGIAVNLKIHGALYVLPNYVFFLCQADSNAMRLRLSVVSGVTAVIALLVPFLPENATLFSYLHSVQLLSKHAIARWMIERNLVFGVMGLTPILWFYLFFTPKLPRGFGWFLTSIIVCMGIVSVLGAIQGAGPYHLLPFLPALFWAFFVIRRRVQDELTTPASRASFEAGTLVLIIALFVGYGPLVAISWDRTVSTFRRSPLAQSATDEINKVLDHNPGLRIAIGPSAGGGFVALRVIPVFRGNPLPIDAVTWSDGDLAGVNDRVVREVVRGCRADLWLFPSGTPFRLEGYTAGRNLFSDAVLADFYANYRQEASGPIFDQWRCVRDR